MSQTILEREPFLALLDDRLGKAVHGNGQCILLGGEAGIGKTALLEAFAERRHGTARFLWGHCEALYTPRPLGPLHDILAQLEGFPEHFAADQADRSTVFPEFLRGLRTSNQPTVILVEDVHWADEATLDWIKYLGRRLQQSPILLIVTYRDDEVGSDHKLWFVFGDLPSKTTSHLHLPPLSLAAVTQLAAETPHPADNLYEITGGNPFFVTEVLGNRDASVPETVIAAVLARGARLSPAGWAVLDIAAVTPGRAELWLIAEVAAHSATSVPDALDECVRTGMLRLGIDAVSFRHELARQAMESRLPPYRARALHEQVLWALLDHGIQSANIARIVHHAIRAEDGAAVQRFAPEAARQAAAQGAHREAASHYAAALRFSDSLTPEQRIELLEGRAYECYLTSQMEAAIEARAEGLALAVGLGDVESVGHTQRWLSRLNWFAGNNAAADFFGAEAVKTLKQLPPGHELAMAYSNAAQLRMLADDLPGARHWGMLAIELATKLGDDETLCHALNNVGTAEYQQGIAAGRAKLEESLRIAVAHGFDEHAARAHTNLAASSVLTREHLYAIDDLERGIAFCITHDLDSWRLYMLGWRARARLDLGEWVAATEDAESLINAPFANRVMRVTALAALGTIRIRRSDPGGVPILDEALKLALEIGESQRIAPVAAARAEMAWLAADLKACHAEAQIGFEAAQVQGQIWHFGQLSYWMWKAGALSVAPEGIAEPYAAQIAGDWQRAAELWAGMRSPYEQALALSEGDVAAQRQALEIFQRLGARAAADQLTRQLEAAGALHIPRGPRPATLRNPARLTARQLEVLRLLAEGLTNSEIADRLSTTPKTVEHHVSSVLAKLNAKSRAHAIAEAHKLGILSTAL